MIVAIIDTETTGLLLPSSCPIEKQPKIIELGIILVKVSGGEGKVINQYNWLINPEIPLPKEITKITGLKDSDLQDKPTFKTLLPAIKSAFDQCDAIIAHNAHFDVGMLKNDLKRVGCTDFKWPEKIICSVQEYTSRFGRKPSMKVLYKAVFGEELKQTHRAMDDAKALYDILHKDGFFSLL